ncbi:hypothetical protein SAMN05216403_101194 [Nitrosospira multiformis ATCC 25196]|uniref:Uncharacterized protein n=1 Tax=Nitrosospira multiformis (strain ATCC 25196 / NCIMB 11849 / C 71) TaxID=323848 RepID=A0A1H5RTB6_NITMU|nr:hypothetical protein SAMN05216411_101137 [Nitrosospira multiformis]SEF41575.1 hypothetical protein SAMN05216403_101194 [Nitrosospira multiformis ATCC 25196]
MVFYNFPWAPAPLRRVGKSVIFVLYILTEDEKRIAHSPMESH